MGEQPTGRAALVQPPAASERFDRRKRSAMSESNKAAAAAVNAVIEGMKAQPNQSMQREFLTMCGTVAISTMHGTLGKEFTREYLETALASLDDPTTVYLREPTRQ
jgi:C-terminal processing protease CtpA/Prc